MSSEMPAVEVVDIVRVFAPRRLPSVTALDHVSLTIPRGEVHGLLGPNGAGKTTLVKILSTVLLPTSGFARICGYDVVREARRVKPLIGIVFGGERGLYGRLTARQNLQYWAALYRLPRELVRQRSADLLARVGLTGSADKRVETYSRGMRQRLHLARGLIGDATVLFLDEPTAGMDPLAARELRRLIADLKGEGRTVLLATHDMAEAETTCDRVTLIDHGHLIATESPRSLSRMASRFRRVDVDDDERLPLAELRAIVGVARIAREEGAMRIHVDREEALRSVLQLLAGRGVTSLRTSRPSLEEVYIELIGDRGMEV